MLDVTDPTSTSVMPVLAKMCEERHEVRKLWSRLTGVMRRKFRGPGGVSGDKNSWDGGGQELRSGPR